MLYDPQVETVQQMNHVVRIGTSPITPAEFLTDLWPEIQQTDPDIKFQLIPYENTPENNRKIFKSLGENIDVVAGVFDEGMLQVRECEGLFIKNMPIRAAVPLRHPLAQKEVLKVSDLFGEELMVIQQGYFADTDALRNDMTAYHPEIKLVDFEIYSLGAFNECYNRNGILAVVDCWEHVHPLMKVIPVEWEYQMSYGLLYSREPAPHVRDFLEIVKRIQQDNDVGYEPHGIC